MIKAFSNSTNPKCWSHWPTEVNEIGPVSLMVLVLLVSDRVKPVTKTFNNSKMTRVFNLAKFNFVKFNFFNFNHIHIEFNFLKWIFSGSNFLNSIFKNSLLQKFSLWKFDFLEFYFWNFNPSKFSFLISNFFNDENLEIWFFYLIFLNSTFRISQ